MGDSDWPNFRPCLLQPHLFFPVDLRVDNHEGTSSDWPIWNDSDWSDYVISSVKPITLLLDKRFVRTGRGSNGRIAVLISYGFSVILIGSG